MLLLYVLRHGEAYPVGRGGISHDADRPLTDKGEAQARRAGALLGRLAERPQLVLTSPLVRARETAREAAAAAGGKAEIRVTEALAPPGNLAALRGEIESSRSERVLLVGHEPFLGELVQYFICGMRDPSLPLSKGMLVSLELETAGEPAGKMRWIAGQKLIRPLLESEKGK